MKYRPSWTEAVKRSVAGDEAWHAGYAACGKPWVSYLVAGVWWGMGHDLGVLKKDWWHRVIHKEHSANGCLLEDWFKTIRPQVEILLGDV